MDSDSETNLSSPTLCWRIRSCFFGAHKNVPEENEEPTRPTSTPPRTLGEIIEWFKENDIDFYTCMSAQHPHINSEKFQELWFRITPDDFQWLKDLRKEQRREIRHEKKRANFDRKMREKMALVPCENNSCVQYFVQLQRLDFSGDSFTLEFAFDVHEKIPIVEAMRLLIETFRLYVPGDLFTCTTVLFTSKDFAPAIADKPTLPMIEYHIDEEIDLESVEPACPVISNEAVEAANNTKAKKRPILQRFKNIFVKKIPRLFGRVPAKSTIKA